MRVAALAAALVAAALLAAASSGGSAMRVPVSALQPTDARVGVFSDQLPDGLSPGLVRFAATHYAGAQKLGLSETRALKRIAPRFFAIQYRLALGLGYRSTDSACRPSGGPIELRFGDAWRREWPAHPREEWFAHRGGSRILNCWGWYLTNPSDRSWQSYYLAQLRRQVVSTGADGAFLDSASVPNELGGSSFRPRLPDYDPRFEAVWRAKLERWLPLVQRRLGNPVIANAGELITTRDHTDYSRIAGVMVEGFAFPGEGSWLAPSDWRLQLDRVLALVRRGRVVIGQTYPDTGDVQARMFALGSYLLVRGHHTYVNLAGGGAVTWFPEYGIDLGRALSPPARSVESLAERGVYVRRFERGLVAVNPDESSASYRPGGAYVRVLPQGGGAVQASGALPASWRVATTPVGSTLTLRPHEAAVLLSR